MYAADGLSHLRPVYGDAPCPRSSPNYVDDDRGEGDFFLGDSTRQEHVDAPISSEGQTLGSAGTDADNSPDKSMEESTKVDVGTALEEHTKPDTATEWQKLETWPHEPKFCASVWPTNDRDGDDNSAGEAPPRLVVLFFFCCFAWLLVFRILFHGGNYILVYW